MSVTVKPYLIVFGTLLALTLVTVAVSQLSLPMMPTIVIGIAIATAKASLVAMFFMHLTSERGMVYVALILTAIFCAALFGLTLWTEADHVPGTSFTGPFQRQP